MPQIRPVWGYPFMPQFEDKGGFVMVHTMQLCFELPKVAQ